MTFDEHSSHMKEVIKNFKTAPTEILEKETECKKPPLGAPPYWIAIDARIREVGGAISRYDSSTQNIKSVKAWAEELIAYCNAVDTIERIQKKYKDDYIPF